MLEFQLSLELHVESYFSDRILIEELVDGELFGDLIVVIRRDFGSLPQILPLSWLQILIHHGLILSIIVIALPSNRSLTKTRLLQTILPLLFLLSLSFTLTPVHLTAIFR